MATSQTPTFRIIISGSDITGLDETNTFTLENKVETSYTIVDTDGNKTLDFSNIENMKSIIFDGSGIFDVTITVGGGANIISFPCDGSIPMVLPVTQTFMSTVDSITISTTSTTDVQVSVRAYGEDAS